MPPPPPSVRRLTEADLPAATALAVEAFGEPPPGAPAPRAQPLPRPGRHEWGAFVPTADGERLAGRMTEREYRSWWGGVEVPTCGIASVAVAAEDRGQGLVAPLFRAVLADAAARGQVLATLYATAPGIYRGAGFELVASLDDVELRTADLAGVRAPGRTSTRRATVGDVPAVRALWDRWAAAQNGPLTRRGVSFPASDDDLLTAVSGISLAVEDRDGVEEVVGYVSWDRGHGYDESARIDVHDLVALGADAYRALWRLVGSFGSVAARVRLRTSGDDVARLVLPGDRWPVVAQHPYMLRLLDVPAALAVLPATPASSAVDLAVSGDRVAGTDGTYRVHRGPDGTRAERVPEAGPVPTVTPGGLALLWSGAQTCANLRWAGLLAGPDDHDPALDRLALRGARHVRDYF